MEFEKAYPKASRKLVSGLVIGLLVGALLPLAAIFQISLLVPVLMLGGIFTAWLKQRSGWIPALVLLTVAAAVSMLLLGLTLTLILAVAALVPALVVIRNTDPLIPFFDQMKAGIIAYCAGLLVAMVIAYVSFGGGMIARFVSLLRSEYDRMPDAALQPLVEWANTMLPSGAGIAGQGITVAYFRSQLSGMLDLLQKTYAEMLPGTLLSGAVLSGVISVFWGNWTLARRGMASEESFVGMTGWFLPAGISVGAVMLLIVGMFMASGDSGNGTTVLMTISQTAGTVFAIQALAALDRRMLRAGRQLHRRRLVIGLFAVGALLFRGMGSALSYVGAASALFGSHGAIRLWFQKRQDDNSGHNGPDE